MWVRRRSRRLLGPVIPLLASWLPAAVVLAALGLPEEFVALATCTAFIPLWFLVAYLGINALVPLTWALHRRAGATVLVVAVVAVAVIDQLHRVHVPFVGFANYALVWGAAHQVGYFWFDERLPRRPGPALGLAAAGGAAALTLVAVGGYRSA